MKVYAPADLSYVTALGVPAEKGEEFEVEPEVGAALIEQGWTSARSKAAKRTGRRRHAQAVEAAKAEGESESESNGETPDSAPDEAPNQEPSE